MNTSNSLEPVSEMSGYLSKIENWQKKKGQVSIIVHVLKSVAKVRQMSSNLSLKQAKSAILLKT